ncbi:beta-1,3-1,4-glucanase, partial [Trichodelitschia bisporula]
MHFSALIVALSSIPTGLAGYVLQDEYNPSNFFDMFNFYSGPDPTEGFVKMLDRPSAQSAGLIMNNASGAYLGVDHINVTPQGRPSLRLESKKTYTGGLIIADIAHMPGSICGAWPAYWTIGPNWPSNGEIDIIEGVNSGKTNAMTLHTNPGCSITKTSNMAGTVRTTNCDIHAPGQGTNVGCAIDSHDTTTYGDGFNAVGGGVYATLWTSDSISVYHFPRNAIPADITYGNPDPSGWGIPQAHFQGSCDFTKAIQQQTIIFDTTFCGQWAGDAGVWGSDAVCSQKAATCNDYVANNPAAFKEAYWLVNYVKVFQPGARASGSSTPSAAPTSSSKAVPTAFPG